jgi:prepilin-type N-terminal cleavage/methylation domain-containing protein
MRQSHGFTFIEFLVAIGIITILGAILIPYVLKVREMSRRDTCAWHLRQIGAALQQYARDSGPKGPLPWPMTVYDRTNHAQGYVAFTGADDPNPFAKQTQVQPNDITASLWLLVRRGYITDLSVFVCPSAQDVPDRLTDSGGRVVTALQRSNFRESRNLSYSYADPFTSAEGFVFSGDNLKAAFAVLADRNPGFSADGGRVVGPSADAGPFELARGNSANHQYAGQNVLLSGGDVAFFATPYSGVGGDNIYTAAGPNPLSMSATRPIALTPGYIGTDLGPAHADDSYLVPTAKYPN